VKLATFGNFVIRRTPPRPGRNPRTSEVVPIGARNVVKFEVSRALKAAMIGDPETLSRGIGEAMLPRSVGACR
jgi:nucleoid DNA-binding protein